MYHIFQGHSGPEAQEGWLGCKLDGKVGWVPQAFVEEISAEEAANGGVAAAAPAAEGGEGAAAAAAGVAEGGSQARILYDWSPSGSDRGMALVKGETVTVTGKPNATWWFGKAEGKEG